MAQAFPTVTTVHSGETVNATGTGTYLVDGGGTLNVNGTQLAPPSLIVDEGGTVNLTAPSSGPQDEGTIYIASGDLVLTNPTFLGPHQSIALGPYESTASPPSIVLQAQADNVISLVSWTQMNMNFDDFGTLTNPHAATPFTLNVQTVSVPISSFETASTTNGSIIVGTNLSSGGTPI